MVKIRKPTKNSAKRLRPKVGKCPFCEAKTTPDWKNFDELKKFISERGRILGVDKTGVCAKHQRRLALAIKRGRHLSLLPFISRAK